MYEQRLLEADDETGAVQLHGEDCVRVAVVADLGPLFEVAHPELARLRLADECQQRAGEEPLHDRHRRARPASAALLPIVVRPRVDRLQLVDRRQREQLVAGGGAECQRRAVLVEADEVDGGGGRTHSCAPCRPRRRREAGVARRRGPPSSRSRDR